MDTEGRTRKKAMTFKEVLNDPESRALVDAIEDTCSSLRGREDDPELQGVLKKQIEDLEAKTGYRYRICND